MGSGASGAWRFFGAAVAVLVVAAAAGFFIPPMLHSGTSAPVTQNQAVSTSDSGATPAQSVTPPTPSPSPSAGQFTAPNAPQIVIDEQKPTQKPKKPPKPVDTEASQTGVNSVPAKPESTSDSGLMTNPSSDATPAPAPTPVEPAVSPPSDTPPATQPNTTPPAQTAPVAAPPASAPDTATSDSTGTVYHVLVGNNFVSERNAKIFASALRHRGYVAVTESVNSVDGVKYKVQVGAYHNKVSAEQEASQLQESGYPAYVAIAQDR